jgi:hypothetical protein
MEEKKMMSWSFNIRGFRMNQKIMPLLGAVAMVLLAFGRAGSFEMTSAIQTELDRLKSAITGWAADPAIVKAVVEQNGKGPIVGMDNGKWKTVRRTDEVVKEFQNNAAGKYLKARMDGNGGMYTEAFLSAAHGEKAAFVEKTTSYIHKGQAKFDVPFDSAKSWQGKAEFDESAQTYQIQISVPVQDGGKTIGVLVAGVNLSQLEKTNKK